jgi:squalene synthase HpnC
MSSQVTSVNLAVLAAAYAECQRLAQAHYENFPVASRLVPAGMRPHVAAVYAFARTADDFADEGTRTAEERIRLLDDWRHRLHACVTESDGRLESDDLDPHGRIFLALGATMRACSLPVVLFDDLLDAFRQDITTTRYATWGEVLDYCRRSANPVGRIVLRIAGHNSETLDRSSDALCTALQLTNFWQDFGRDWQKGRLYVPIDEVTQWGARTEDLDDRRITDAWRGALGIVGGRTRNLFAKGRHVCEAVGGRLGYELRLTWLGGMRVLERVERSGYDVFADRPTLGVRDGVPLFWRALTWTLGSGPRS